GKDRMTDLSPDPWTSPLREASLFELVRWRFLQGARAVMNVDLTDLLQPGTDPFATVQDSSTGVLQMVGQRIYPWRVRKGATPSFGDHICRQFDSAQPNRRWCVAPARLSPDQVWRYVRVSNTTPAEEEIVPFWRAMAIRHHDSAPSQIVPKTSLIEDPALVKLARTAFRHKPVFPPSSKIKDQPAQPGETGRTCIVTTMKNEGPFILEWIAYHRAIGVEDFLVYTNDCTDGTDDLLDLLQAKGLVQHRDNPFRQTGLKPQHAALQAAEEEEILQKAGWAICMDVDEYINIHCGEGRLKDLFDRIGDANMISLTWRLFGNDDVHEFRDGFIIEQFNRCAPELCRKPHQAWGFKTLFRNIGIYKKMGVHRPKGLKPDLWDQITWVNGSGEPMPRSLLRNGWRSTTESYGYELVTLNHYAVRSAESFLVKRDRGRVNHVDRDQGLGYWFRMNNNWQKDRSIHGKLPLLREEFDRLMADPEIRAAHEFCVLRHRAKIDELRDSPAYAAFYKELTSPRMERLSRLHTHFGANVFLAGPSAIPDEVANLKAIAPDFFFTVERAETNH
ncbi:MAG: glycosyltransferase family 2 protein, partial [Litoreibacter sp.]|nr:glycosyltransferase family 2 protein [Litoreibacter sp.]